MKRFKIGSVILSSIECFKTRPCKCLLSGSNAIPKFRASATEDIFTGEPSIRIWPVSILSTPKIARTNSERPLPTRPAIPRTSPS